VSEKYVATIFRVNSKRRAQVPTSCSKTSNLVLRVILGPNREKVKGVGEYYIIGNIVCVLGKN
jgi:hypothetical protein